MTFQHFFANRRINKAAVSPVKSPVRLMMRVAQVSSLALLASNALAFDSFSLTRPDGHNIPTRIYSEPGNCRGFVILSHGAGGNEKGMVYLAEDLSLSGWMTLSIAHTDSGLRALMKSPGGKSKKLKNLGTDTAAYMSRMQDIETARRATDFFCPGKPRYLIGHSMGAVTVMMEAMVPNKLNVAGEDRFDAYVALSPQGPGALFNDDAWGNLKKPMLTMTGTRDDNFGKDYTGRTFPYTTMPMGCKWSAVLKDATHGDFGAGRRDTNYRLEISGTIMAFLDAFEKKDCKHGNPLPGVTLLTK